MPLPGDELPVRLPGAKQSPVVRACPGVEIMRRGIPDCWTMSGCRTDAIVDCSWDYMQMWARRSAKLARSSPADQFAWMATDEALHSWRKGN